MTESNTAGTREPHLEVTHVQHTDTGITATHTALTALAGWIQKVVDTYNDENEPTPGEVNAVENPLHDLLHDSRTQMIRPGGRLALIELLYAMSRKETAGPAGSSDADAGHLRRLAGELATTIRCLHHIREDDHVLLVVE